MIALPLILLFLFQVISNMVLYQSIIDAENKIRELKEEVNGLDIEIELNSVRDEMKEIKSKL